jgi:hypothetical protein
MKALADKIYIDAKGKRKHSFDVETSKGMVEISNCASRVQARSVATKAGYEVINVSYIW